MKSNNNDTSLIKIVTDPSFNEDEKNLHFMTTLTDIFEKVEFSINRLKL